MTADVVALHERATEEFTRRAQAVGAAQWHLPTPCSEWDVRALVQHVANECLWAPPLFEGQTIAEVGDRFEGDVLGHDPKAAYEEAAVAAHAAVAAGGAMERTVHLSFGDVPGAEYATQLTFDLTVHAWDLARAIGADESLDAELAKFCLAWLRPNLAMVEGSGMFAPPVDAGPGAPVQEQLLALTGRTV